MYIDIIGVPIAYGTDRHGADKAPDKLRELGLFADLDRIQGLKINDRGDVYVARCPEYDKLKWNRNMMYFKPILDMSRDLAEMTSASVARGHFPLVIGGDHSAAIGSISGIASPKKQIAVLWIDAHGDINDSETSPSKHVHGMPNAFLLGEEKNEFYDISFTGPKLRSENLYMLGQRDLDSGEQALISKNGIQKFSAEELRSFGYEKQLEKIRQNIVKKGITHVHLSFDLDFIDKSLVPGTGTPVSSGATIEEARLLLEITAKWGLVKSMDFVELNPELDIDNASAELSLELLTTFFRHFAINSLATQRKIIPSAVSC